MNRRMGEPCHALVPQAGGDRRSGSWRVRAAFLGLLGTRHGRRFRCLRQSRCRAEHAKRAGQERQTSDEGEGPHASVHSRLLSAIALLHLTGSHRSLVPRMFTLVEARRLSNEASVAVVVKRLEERAFHGNPCGSSDIPLVRQDCFRWCCFADIVSEPFANGAASRFIGPEL